MSKQKVKGGELIHVDISRWCSAKPGQKRDLIFECHLHKAIWWQRLQLAWTLLIGKAIHLKMAGDRMKIGDRVVSEIEL